MTFFNGPTTKMPDTKETFSFFPIDNNKYFDFTILLNYVFGWQSRSFVSMFISIFGKKKYGSFSFWEKTICQNPFWAI